MRFSRLIGVIGGVRASVLMLVLVVVLAGCGGRASVPADPLATAQDPSRTSGARLRAVAALPGSVEAGDLSRDMATRALYGLAWQRRQTTALRLAAIASLFELAEGQSTESGAGSAARSLVLEMLPTERDRSVSADLSKRAAELGWTDAAAAIVRAFSDPDQQIEDRERGEHAALAALFPEREVVETVFAVFADPDLSGSGSPIWTSVGRSVGGAVAPGLEGRVRRDAWELLSRLDASGEARVRLLQQTVVDGSSVEDETLRALGDGLTIARVIPLTGEELEWLTAMRSDGAAAERWWGELRGALKRLDADQRRGMRLRHLEAVRWASVHRTPWLTLGRDGLIERITERLGGRVMRQRSVSTRATRTAAFADHAAGMSWPALLSLLVVDEAVHDARVLAGLSGQIPEDRADRSTEYGGLLIALDADEGDHARDVGEFRAGLYRPRPSERVGDERFVASRFMIADSTLALAHYHFHAQRVDNTRYAGPSAGDLEYAARHGRLCLVFTTVGESEIDVDLYTPEGVVIGLGAVDLSVPVTETAARRR
ncbi:MAG: hypothetical protein AAF108_07770 [Planctomycetota bacterium]